MAARFEVNLSILFTELPLLDRPQAAKDAGFDAVEFWWPWSVAVPSDAEIAQFVTAVKDAGVSLVGLNFFAGDMAGGDRGLVSWPARSAEFRDNIDVTVGMGEQLGCRAFNALYGNRQDGVSPEEQDELGAENLALAADAAERIGGGGAGRAGQRRRPLPAAHRGRRAGRHRPGLRRDPGQHQAPVRRLPPGRERRRRRRGHRRGAGRIGHVQIADAPGRNEPGTGKLDIDRYLDRIYATGYDGWVGLEYKPSGASADCFDWLPRERRAARTS